jgi:hypothetical protein
VRIKSQQGWYFTGDSTKTSVCFKASHLCYTCYNPDQCQAVVKLHGVFSSCCGQTASLPPMHFHRAPSLRQYPHHYAIRAGQNLPDKEFRYLRTVIVTAAVHWGFSSHREALPLTFQHRAGVSPYTSTFVLAETYVFGKQLHGFFSCGPLTYLRRDKPCG